MRELRPRAAGWAPFAVMAGVGALVLALWQLGPPREIPQSKRGVPTLKLEYKLNSLEAPAKP